MPVSSVRNWSAIRRMLLAFLMAGATLPAGAHSTDPPAVDPADEPPEPPIARNDEYYPISYRSFASDFTDDREEHAKTGYRQGTMTYSEWWYAYERVDYYYLVGIGLLTITPNSPSLTNWNHLEDFNFVLSHEAEGCRYQASKPDEDSPGIQLSAGVTITADGPEIGGGVAWGVLADGVTVTEVERLDQSVNWTADISDGSGTAKGGVNDLLFFAEWRCPKKTDFWKASAHYSGYGGFELDDWGSGDTSHTFTSGGYVVSDGYGVSDGPVDGASSDRWRYDPDKGWVHLLPPPRPRRQQAAVPAMPDQRPQLANEQRLARLEAIERLRGGSAPSSGTEVIPSLRSGDSDPSAQARADARARIQEVERYGRRSHEMVAAAPAATGPRLQPEPLGEPAPPPVEEETASDAVPPTSVPAIEVPSPYPAAAPPPEEPAASLPPVQEAPPPVETGIGGTYQLADTSSGVSRVLIAISGGRTTLTGMGPPILLEQDGDTYFGEGAVLFGQGDHQIRLRPRGNGLELFAQHPGGGSFTTLLLR